MIGGIGGGLPGLDKILGGGDKGGGDPLSMITGMLGKLTGGESQEAGDSGGLPLPPSPDKLLKMLPDPTKLLSGLLGGMLGGGGGGQA
jgi:hypothetical protein